MKVRYTPRAFADIEFIRLYIVQFNPEAAARVASAIETLAGALADFPGAGHPAPGLDARVLHSPRYPYRIYYRVRGDEISILHVRHTSRRPPQAGQV
jgi:toxin ParE1/3/4